jgi:hypothetical protein
MTDPTLLTGALPPINRALEPASVRDGNAAAKQAYQVGLSFEEMLVNQLAQELSSTISGASDGSALGGSDSSAGSTDDSAGGSGSDPASGAYAGLIPDALTTSLMSGGGLGVAQQIAAAIDPAINSKK